MLQAILRLVGRIIVGAIPALVVGVLLAVFLPTPLAVILALVVFTIVFFRERIAASPLFRSSLGRFVVAAVILLPLYAINPLYAVTALLIIIFVMAIIGIPQFWREAENLYNRYFGP